MAEIGFLSVHSDIFMHKSFTLICLKISTKNPKFLVLW